MPVRDPSEGLALLLTGRPACSGQMEQRMEGVLQREDVCFTPLQEISEYSRTQQAKDHIRIDQLPYSDSSVVER